MNKSRRNRLSRIREALERHAEALGEAFEEEEGTRLALEEHFEGTERYEECRQAAEKLEECLDGLQSVLEGLEELTAWPSTT